MTPFGRKGEIIGAPSRGIEELAARSGTISESGRLVGGADGGTIAMRIEYLAAIAIAAVVGSLPPDKQSTPAAAQLATLLAESVDPFVHRSGG